MNQKQKNNISVWYQMASMEWSLRNMKRLGFAPRNIVDVGAYQGEWTAMAKAIFPDANVLMIEAQSSKKKILEEVCLRYINTASYAICLLGAEARKGVAFHEMETGSSVLREKSNIKSVTTSCDMITLDDVVAKNIHGKVDLLKLDVQGYELEVLRGGSYSLQDADAVLMEVSLLSINKEAPLLSEVVEFMAKHGFVAYDICSLMRRPLDNALCQTDFLFVKETSPLLQDQSYGR